MRLSHRSFLLFFLRESAALIDISKYPPTRNIKITNNCPEGIHPAIVGSAGTPLNQTGFYLASNDARIVVVPSSWVGRVWARTNCTFDGNGRGHCSTGDCDKKLMCGATSGEKPHTIAEFTVTGDKNETYYDISTVDGYNVDMAIIPEESAGAVLSCSSKKKNSLSSSLQSNHSPLSWANTGANIGVSRPEKGALHWCPHELLLTPPKENSSSLFNPDDDDPKGYFSPCHSACSKWGREQDCCSGEYDNPEKCKPGLYSKRMKDVCPDAYSFAYDDVLSTFTLPSGPGFEVVFCPDGKSSGVSKGQEEKCDDLEEAAKPLVYRPKSGAEGFKGTQAYVILLSLPFPIFLIMLFI
ncbi:thaumatin family-domain-containing protein [Tuber brumale]|nr:thaumatin family-domain-containing protein [Tuber brumale]